MESNLLLLVQKTAWFLDVTVFVEDMKTYRLIYQAHRKEQFSLTAINQDK